MNGPRSFEELIDSFDAEAGRFAENWTRTLRSVATAGYNFGQLDALRGVVGFKGFESSDESREAREFVRRLWEDEQT